MVAKGMERFYGLLLILFLIKSLVLDGDFNFFFWASGICIFSFVVRIVEEKLGDE